MMIGVFDSGLGWLLTLRYLKEKLPEYSYCYLWDTKHIPYGTKDPQWIHDRTFQCSKWLFDQWCALVILACNSASTYAIRSRQATYPELKMLSVTLPGVEAVIAGWWKYIGVLWTKATIESNLYPSFFERHFPTYEVHIEQAIWGDLVNLIEWNWSQEQIDQECNEVMKNFSDDMEALILWCTHYPIVQKSIQKNLPWGVFLIDPAKESADKLPEYLSHHSEIESLLEHNGEIFFNVTWDVASFHNSGSMLWGSSITAELVSV